MSPKTKSKNPAYPDAHPTAPGGMSEKALVAELVDKHGWSKADATALKWPAKIDAVVEARLLREHEAAQSESRLLSDGVMFAEPESEDDDFDPDDLMAELVQAQDEAADEPIQYGLLTKDKRTLDYIFDGHAGAGPSASERWMHCTASLGASRAFLETLTPNQQEQFAVSNEAARQGTTAHAAAEIEARMILGEVSRAEVDATLLELAVMPDSEGEAYDDEMAEYITEYTDLIRTYAQERGNDHVLIEQRLSAAVPLTGSHEGEVHEIPGSSDCIVLPTPEDPTLVGVDLKYGDGIDVDVTENPQVRIYVLGALGLLVDDDGNLITNVETITYHIVQPRLGGIKTWSEPLADLLQWRDEVLAPALTAALYGPAEGAAFAPSEQACQFCPARGSCAALAEQRLTQAADLFDVVVEAEYVDGPGAFPETAALTDSRIGELLTQIKGLITIYEDLKEEAQRRLFRGDRVPGWQLVNYSPPRKWAEGATEAIADDAPIWKPPALLTPTAALKALADDEETKAAVETWIETPDKRPVIAPDGDRRKPWTGRPPEAMFDIEEDS